MLYLIILIIAIGCYYYATRNHGYWQKRNVKCVPPIPLFGNHFRNLAGIRNVTEISTELYNQFPGEKVVGYYKCRIPELIIKDLDIVRDILNVDFNYFYKRGACDQELNEPLLKNIFHLDGDTWKLLRSRLSQAFTAAKLKNMFQLITQSAEKLQHLGVEIVSRGGECDVRELMARFVIEVIGAYGLGIEMNSINDENSLFTKFGLKIFAQPVKNPALFFFFELFPEIRSMIKVVDPVIENIMTQLFTSVRKQRDYKPSKRNDFVDLLLELESQGKIEGESIEKRNADGSPVSVEMEIDLECMVAQVFIFFAAGFETSSSATSYTLHQLAFHPDIQRKIQVEVDEVLSKYNNKICYDAISEMTLLQEAFKESLRMFPSVGVLHRVCAKQYTIPKLGITIDPGVKISIPIQAIQMDPQYFDNPKEFRPERFKNDELKGRQKYAYLPFGDGPRYCIGSRLGQIQSIAALAAVLQKFTVEPCATTLREVNLDHAQNIVQGIKGDHLQKLGFRVDLVPVDYVNYCMIEICGYEVFRCNIKNLSFNTPAEQDVVCRRAINAVMASSTRLSRARTYLWFWALLEDQTFRRTDFAPKDVWPFKVDVEKLVQPLDCLTCCITQKDICTGDMGPLEAVKTEA
ncbi:cytochrome P450 6B6-like [Epargyreus clarus]|uniref:cytochrome P450 6B6-like n=1 Tax=Epargyreus clarus TaxID=520877 RepID=UPI003C307FD7